MNRDHVPSLETLNASNRCKGIVSKLQKTIGKQRGSKVAYTATAHTHRDSQVASHNNLLTMVTHGRSWRCSTSFIVNRDGLGLGLGTVALALALIVFGLGLDQLALALALSDLALLTSLVMIHQSVVYANVILIYYLSLFTVISSLSRSLKCQLLCMRQEIYMCLNI